MELRPRSTWIHEKLLSAAMTWMHFLLLWPSNAREDVQIKLLSPWRQQDWRFWLVWHIRHSCAMDNNLPDVVHGMYTMTTFQAVGYLTCAFLHVHLHEKKKFYLEICKGFKQYNKSSHTDVLKFKCTLYDYTRVPELFKSTSLTMTSLSIVEFINLTWTCVIS